MEILPITVDTWRGRCYINYIKEAGEMTILEELRKRKKELKLTNQDLADLSGLPLGTVQKVMAGVTQSPRYDTIKALEKVLRLNRKNQKDRSEKMDPKSSYFQAGSVKEAGPAYGSAAYESDGILRVRSGNREEWHTYQDYIALPEDRRVELIDGKFYDMASPNSTHQIIIGQLHLQFTECVRNHPGCMVLLSPMDVMLDEDEYTVVQPDLMVFCNMKRLRKGRVFGAPDLVVEVVSPGSASRDHVLKMAKYMGAGVREYWIIDRKKGKVVVYYKDPEKKEEDASMQEGSNPYAPPKDDAPEIAIYGMEDEVPVRISEGKCRIQMAPITELLESLGDIG